MPNSMEGLVEGNFSVVQGRTGRW